MESKTEVRMLSPEQVHEMTGLSVNTLANWRSRGEGPEWIKPIGEKGRTGGMIQYPEDKLEQWLASRGMTAKQMQLYLAHRMTRRNAKR